MQPTVPAPVSAPGAVVAPPVSTPGAFIAPPVPALGAVVAPPVPASDAVVAPPVSDQVVQEDQAEDVMETGQAELVIPQLAVSECMNLESSQEYHLFI